MHATQTRRAMTLSEAQDIVASRPAAAYYRDHYRAWESAYLPRVIERILQLPPDRAVDIGPGWGTMMTWLHGNGWEVDVVDLMSLDHWISTEQAVAADAWYVRHDISSGPVPELPGGTYDLLLSGQVLGHVKFRPDGALWNIRHLLKPDGVAFIHVLDRTRAQIESATARWRDLPEWGKGEPTEMMNSTQYDRADFNALLLTAFEDVRLLPDDGSAFIFGECRKPRERKPGEPGLCSAVCAAAPIEGNE